MYVCYFYRVNRLERDTSQKRTLLEEQRSKLKQVQSTAKTDANAMVSKRTEIHTKAGFIFSVNFCKHHIKICFDGLQ